MNFEALKSLYQKGIQKKEWTDVENIKKLGFHEFTDYFISPSIVFLMLCWL